MKAGQHLTRVLSSPRQHFCCRFKKCCQMGRRRSSNPRQHRQHPRRQQIMTSLSRDQTDNIQPSSSAEKTADQEQPSLPSVSSGLTKNSTQTMPTQSQGTSPADNTDNTLSTTLKITERSRQHADIAKAALLQLEKVGLVRRIKVLSKDPTTGATTPKEIRIVFDPTLWSDNLDLK